MVGPSQSGKTVLSNFLSDPAQVPLRGIAEYRPTKGCRIVDLHGAQIWDVSGDDSYAECWTAVGRNADGVIMVFNPDEEGQEQELIPWFERFVDGQGLTKDQTLILANQTTQMKGRAREPDLPSSLRSIELVATNTQERTDVLQSAFDEFLREVVRMKKQNQNREELSVLQGGEN